MLAPLIHRTGQPFIPELLSKLYRLGRNLLIYLHQDFRSDTLSRAIRVIATVGRAITADLLGKHPIQVGLKELNLLTVYISMISHTFPMKLFCYFGKEIRLGN